MNLSVLRSGIYSGHRNKNNNFQWDRTWASIASLEGRLQEIIKTETGKYDGFLYTLYSWFSSALHGSPVSFSEVVELSQPLHAKLQPEKEPLSQVVASFVTLMFTIRALASDTGTFKAINPEFSKLERALRRLMGQYK